MALLWLSGFACGAFVVHVAYKHATSARVHRARGSALGIAKFRKRQAAQHGRDRLRVVVGGKPS